MDKATLRNKLLEHFSKAELFDLCFDLDIDHELLAGETKREKTRELIDYCYRHTRIEELIWTFHKLRPNATLPTIDSNTTLIEATS